MAVRGGGGPNSVLLAAEATEGCLGPRRSRLAAGVGGGPPRWGGGGGREESHAVTLSLRPSSPPLPTSLTFQVTLLFLLHPKLLVFLIQLSLFLLITIQEGEVGHSPTPL